MTIEIDEQRRARVIGPVGADHAATGERDRLILGVWIASALAFVGGLALTAMDLVTSFMPNYSIYAVACYIAAAIGLGVLGVDRLLADRQEFYRRGQLDGWMRGWRGQEPETDDPLLR